MINKVLNRLDNNALRWILIILIRIMYSIRSRKSIKNVFYHSKFRVWGYQFRNTFFWNTGPGWVTCKSYFESQLLQYFANQYIPKYGDVVIDLGAGLGEEMIILSEWVGQLGKIYCIEATPRVANALEYALEANRLQNVLVFNLAISNKTETVKICDDSGYVGNTIQAVVDNNINQFKVRGITLDDFVSEQQIQCVDLLKVNIEGAEQFMIMGMENSLAKIKNIAISCHDFRHTVNNESEFYRTLDKVKDYFSSKGFSVLTLPSGDILQRHIVFGKNLAFKQ